MNSNIITNNFTQCYFDSITTYTPTVHFNVDRNHSAPQPFKSHFKPNPFILTPINKQNQSLPIQIPALSAPPKTATPAAFSLYILQKISITIPTPAKNHALFTAPPAHRNTINSSGGALNIYRDHSSILRTRPRKKTRA